jgi:pilus assembly protein CpaF
MEVGAMSGMLTASRPTPEVVEEVREHIARDGAALSPEVVASALRSRGRPVGDATVLAVLDVLRRDVVGAGPLEHLLRADGVTDVLVNGAGAVYVDRGEGLELTGVTFEDDAAVRRLAQRLAAGAGRRLDDSSPFVDLRLADGSRFHAVLAPLARPGTVISLRIPRRRAFTLAELQDAGTLPPEGARLLHLLIARRLAFLVSGGTGSGKTTLLNALLSRVDPVDRIVVVEDTTELRPDHPHVVGLEARPANVEGAGQVALQTLVRQALRMRPDRLVVGEVRGAEVVDLFAAMNTGHEGGCGTVHANSAADVPARLEGLALAAGMPVAAVHAQMSAAISVVVHCVRDRDGRRRVGEIAVLGAAEGGRVAAVPAVAFLRGGSVVEHAAAARLAELLQHP